jgi:AraC-like DNA-binding protein
VKAAGKSELPKSVRGENPGPQRDYTGRRRVALAKALVLKNLAEEIPLREIARHAGCSPAYMSRTFARLEGVTLSRWQQSQRLARAADLLSTGKCNVTEAAKEVGYRSLSHFSRAFKEEHGVLPSRWLRQPTTRQKARGATSSRAS